MLYKQQANIRIDFFETKYAPPTPGQKADEKYQEKGSSLQTVDKYHKLYGFLSDEGLSLSLTNRFANALDLVGSIFGQIADFMASTKAMSQMLGITNQTQSYITSGFGNGNSIVLNAPYYWQGTDPIKFNLSLFQIADTETQIIENYQKTLEIMSPIISKTGDDSTLNFLGAGPGIAYVHYFPSTQEGQTSTDGEGVIKFGPCLCHSVSMEIKPPYSYKYMPIIGAYRFEFSTARIVDRTNIAKIFGNIFPYKSNVLTPADLPKTSARPDFTANLPEMPKL